MRCTSAPRTTDTYDCSLRFINNETKIVVLFLYVLDSVKFIARTQCAPFMSSYLLLLHEVRCGVPKTRHVKAKRIIQIKIYSHDERCWCVRCIELHTHTHESHTSSVVTSLARDVLRLQMNICFVIDQQTMRACNREKPNNTK